MSNLDYNIPEVFDVNTLSEYLGVSTQLIRRYIKEKNIPYFKLGNKYFFRKKTVEEYLEAQEKKHMILQRQRDMQKVIKRINES